MAPVWPRTILSCRFLPLCASLKARIIAAPIGSNSTLCTTMSALLAVAEKTTMKARRNLMLVAGEDLLRFARPLIAVLVHLRRVPPVVLDLRQIVALDAGEVLPQREVAEAVDRLLPVEAGGPLDEHFRASRVGAAFRDRHAAGEERAAF